MNPNHNTNSDSMLMEEWPQYHHRDSVHVLVFNGQSQAMVFENATLYSEAGPTRVTWGVPQTTLTNGDDPQAVAERIVRDQTGFESSDWRYLGSYLADDTMPTGAGHYYLACEAAQTAPPVDPRPVRWVTPQELKNGLWDGRVNTLSVVVAIALGLLALRRSPISAAVAHITAHQRRVLSGYEYGLPVEPFS